MLSQKSTGRFLPYFLQEHAVRKALQALFVSTALSTENAGLVLNTDPSKATFPEPKGNPMARSAFKWAWRWLARQYEFSVSPQIFEEMILNPVRSSCRFLLEARSLQKRTTSVICYVFSKSTEWYDRMSNERMVMLSVLIPQLQTASTIRVPADRARNVSYGVWRIENVQPVPFVNRLHPFNAQFTKVKSSPATGTIDYLKTSMSDRAILPKCFVPELFCEVQSLQLDRRRLVMPCLMTGMLVSVQTPLLTLRNPLDQNDFMQAAITQCLMAQIQQQGITLESMAGKTVLALVGLLYRPKKEWYPEVFLLEAVDEKNESIDDLIGHIRVRTNVAAEAVAFRYGREILNKLPASIIKVNNELKFAGRHIEGSDKIISILSKEVAKLEKMRSDAGGVIAHTTRRIYDRRKVSVDGLIRLVSQDGIRKQAIVSLLRLKDHLSNIPKYVPDIIRMLGDDGPKLAEAIQWMHDLGIIKREESGMQFTTVGAQVADSVIGPDMAAPIDTALRSGRVIDVIAFSSLNKFPVSSVVGALKKMEDEGRVKCLSIGGRRCKLLWLPVSNQNVNEGRNIIEGKLKQVLTIMRNSPCSVSTAEIASALATEKLQGASYVVEMLLQELLARGKISNEKQSWVYPLQQRVVDFVDEEVQGRFRIEELMSTMNISTAEKYNVSNLLAGLARKQILTEIGPGIWTATKNLKISKLDFSRDEMKKELLAILKGRSGSIESGVLFGRLLKKASDLKIKADERYNFCTEVIDDLLDGGLITEKGGIYYLTGRS